MKREMSQSEERLTAALRDLAAASRQGPSPELGVAIKEAFHRHHVRRQRVRTARIGAIVICLAILAALPFFRKSSVARPDGQATTVRTIPPEEVNASPNISISQARPRVTAKRATPDRRKPLTMAQFVALPSMDEVPPGNELRVVRLELPVKSLRLVGVPVDEEIPDHRVLADFVVGPDRTPYAVRFVSYPVRRGE